MIVAVLATSKSGTGQVDGEQEEAGNQELVGAVEFAALGKTADERVAEHLLAGPHVHAANGDADFGLDMPNLEPIGNRFAN
jgi:hypothetical protein